MKGFLSFGKGAGIVLLVLVLALTISFAAACDDDDDNDNDNGESSVVNAAAITVTPMSVVMLYPEQTYPASWPGGTIKVVGSGFVPEEEVALTLVGAQLMEGETITTKDISIGLPYFASSSGIVEFLWQSTPVTLQPGAYSMVATGKSGSAASAVLTIGAEQLLPPGLAPRIEAFDISGDGKIDNYAGEMPGLGPATEFFKIRGSGFTPGEIITFMLPGGYQGRDVIFSDPFPPGPDRTAPYPPPIVGADGTFETNPPLFVGGAPLDPGVYTLLAGIFQPPGVGLGTGWQGFASMATYPLVLEEVE
jgi:hypothetical protein